MSTPQARAITIPSVFRDSSLAVRRAAAPVGKRRLDIPTLGIALAVYGGFVVSTWFFHHMPILIAAPMVALLLTWYGSLQHETIHGHPTGSRRLNAMLAGLPLSLWLPYGSYRATHLQHHRHGGRHLTDVSRDPESFYVRSGLSSRAGPLGRALRLANCTLAGRLILGPAIAHHAHPKLAWYELPRVWREMRGSAVGLGLVFRGGYAQVFREYLFRSVISVEHPGSHLGDG
jgi:fatty acid desaturase